MKTNRLAELFLAVFCAARLFGGLADAQAEAVSTKNWMARGDALYSQRTELARSGEALADFDSALKLEPNNVEALWKFARAAWWVGTQSKDRSVRLKAFQQGREAAQKAIAENPDSVAAHFWFGSNMASYGDAKGAFTSLILIHSIRREMDIVCRLDRAYMGGGADRILGIIDYKIPSAVGGDQKRALAHLSKSLELDPTNPVTLFYLADYFSQQGKTAEARSYLQKLETTAPTPEFTPEYPAMREEGRALAAKLTG